MKTRINPKTGREEYWIEPSGLPGIWVARGFCDRCYRFNKCLGFLDIDDREWNELENMMDQLLNNTERLESIVLEKQLNKCC